MNPVGDPALQYLARDGDHHLGEMDRRVGHAWNTSPELTRWTRA
jgi:hypothetical protein